MSKLISQSENIFVAGSSGMVGRLLKKVLLNGGYGDALHGEYFMSIERSLDLENF